MKNQLQEAKAWLRFAVRGLTEKVNINEIPPSWERFRSTDDRWIKLPFPASEDTSGCIYKAKKGSIFKPHFHEKNVEDIFVRSGKIEAFTPTWNQVLLAGKGVRFEMGESHCIEFLEDTVLVIMWHPQMGGWQASFD
jgi:hypothetical protein